MDSKLYDYLVELLEEELDRVENQPFCGASEWAAEAFSGIVASQVADVEWAKRELKKLNDVMTIAGIPSSEYEEQMI